MATPRAAPPRCSARAAPRPRDVHGVRDGGVHRANASGAGGDRRAGPQADGGHSRCVDAAGSAGRPTGWRRRVEPGDRSPALHQHQNGRVSPAQDVPKAWRAITDAARPADDAVTLTGPKPSRGFGRVLGWTEGRPWYVSWLMGVAVWTSHARRVMRR